MNSIKVEGQESLKREREEIFDLVIELEIDIDELKRRRDNQEEFDELVMWIPVLFENEAPRNKIRSETRRAVLEMKK